MYVNHEMMIVRFSGDEQFVAAITPGSVIDGDGNDNYSLKPSRADS